MSIASSHSLGGPNALYTPFRGVSRRGAVGTVHLRGNDVGEAGGGTVKITLTATGNEFEFPALLVPTVIACDDTLATAENVEVLFNAASERLSQDFRMSIQMLSAAARNLGQLTGSKMPMEFSLDDDEVTMMVFTWLTNTDTKVYIAHMFATVYDRQAMARSEELDVGGPLIGPL